MCGVLMGSCSLVKKITLTVFYLVLIILLLIYIYPPMIGGDSSYVVLSGSMRPELNPGDLIIVKRVDPSLVEVGDIVTVKSGDRIFTHRVVEKKVENGVILFRTKGDANEDPDPEYSDVSQLIGKVVFVIPFGYLHTPYGFVLTILTPTLIIIGKNMHRVYQLSLRRNRRQLKKWRRKMRKSTVLDPTTMLLTLILLIGTTRLIAPRLQTRSVSYFYDQETEWVSISAGTWVVEADVDIDPDILNLGSEGEWITAYIEIAGYNMSRIDVSTITLGGNVEVAWGEVQDDGRLMVKFNRSSVIDYLISMGCGDGDQVRLKISGYFPDGTRFEGYDTIILKEAS